MATEKQYYDRMAKIDAAYLAIRPVGAYWSYITDECVDCDNSNDCEKNSPEFWDSMLMSLDCAAAMRLEEMGIAWSSFPVSLNY
jgi:hypothetical protein